MGTATLIPDTLRKSTARELLEKHGLANAWPVPLEELAQLLGYKCYSFSAQTQPNLKTISGFVDHDSKAIYINGDEPLVRQRFTLAHEIGHVVLHNGIAPIDLRKTMLTSPEPKETEANRFASELLMDKLLFARKWFELKGDIEALACYFGVSEEAARIRIQTLKLERV